ncbi:hypothetical protein QYM36_011373 [Artemia franciscana]|uniref:C2H2-type domain-containing protein n=2 Tax=Artemia franciscana TaxID=6661 RepID=A0AA88L4L6_ARTSF|nr:hypothetical protein QYM36_011373 [Artemia franciscana]
MEGNALAELSCLKEEIQDQLQIKTDEPLGTANTLTLQNDMELPERSSCSLALVQVDSNTVKEEEKEASSSSNGHLFKIETSLPLPETVLFSPVDPDPLDAGLLKPEVSNPNPRERLKRTSNPRDICDENLDHVVATSLDCDICKQVQNSLFLLELHKSTLCGKTLPLYCEKCNLQIKDFPDFALHFLEHEAGTERKCLICLCNNIDNMREHVLSAGHMPSLSPLTESKPKETPEITPRKYQLRSKPIQHRNNGFLKDDGKTKVKKDSVRNGRSRSKTSGCLKNLSSTRCRKTSGCLKDLSSTPETVWLIGPSNQSKQLEKIYLRTTVPIKKLSKRTIDETSVGKWRCNTCGKIENSCYLLQVHNSTNCETGLSFNCEICSIEINNYKDFTIHHMEHEIDKGNQCPICLCTNIRNIKEHVIMKGHVSRDITGLEFPDYLSNLNKDRKPKPSVVFNSAINGGPQDLEDKDPLSSEDNADSKLDFKIKFDDSLHHSEALPNQSVTTRPIIDGSEDEKPLPNKSMEFQYNNSLTFSSRSGSSSIRSNMDCVMDPDVEQFKTPSGLFETAVPNLQNYQADILTSVETKNISIAMDTVVLPPVSHEPMQDDEKPAMELQQSIGNIKKESVSITQSTPSDLEKSNLRRRNSKAIYYESCDSDIDDVSDEEIDKYNREAYEACSEDSQTGKQLEMGPSEGHTRSDSGKNKRINRRSSYSGKLTLATKVKNAVGEKIPSMQLSGKSHICRICNEAFSLRLSLLSHFKIHDEIEIQQCRFYCSKLQNKCDLVRRFDSQGGAKDGPYECNICKKTLTRRESFLSHMRRHVKGRQFLCNSCGVGFFSKVHLDLHMQMHTGEKNFTCERCGMQFRQSKTLKYHMDSHLRNESGKIPEKLFECEICSLKFKTQKCYSNHKRRHTVGATHECGICKRKCYTKFRLVEHMRIHTGEKPFKCKICNKALAHMASLVSHLKCHSNERPYTCEFCNEAFKDKIARDDHVNSHTGDTPHKCKLCDMCFGSRKNLKNHQRVHTKKAGEKKIREKKYGCSICNKVFAESSYRDQHVALHSNPTPFSCEYCSKSFNYKRPLLAHVRRVHPSRNPFKCKLCSKTYDSIRKIDLHISSRVCDKNGKLLEKLANLSSSFNVDGNVKLDNTLLKADKNIKLFVCNMCDEEFLSVGEIQCHFNSSHKHFK